MFGKNRFDPKGNLLPPAFSTTPTAAKLSAGKEGWSSSSSSSTLSNNALPEGNSYKDFLTLPLVFLKNFVRSPREAAVLLEIGLRGSMLDHLLKNYRQLSFDYVTLSRTKNAVLASGDKVRRSCIPIFETAQDALKLRLQEIRNEYSAVFSALKELSIGLAQFLEQNHYFATELSSRQTGEDIVRDKLLLVEIEQQLQLRIFFILGNPSSPPGLSDKVMQVDSWEILLKKLQIKYRCPPEKLLPLVNNNDSIVVGNRIVANRAGGGDADSPITTSSSTFVAPYPKTKVAPTPFIPRQIAPTITTTTAVATTAAPAPPTTLAIVNRTVPALEERKRKSPSSEKELPTAASHVNAYESSNHHPSEPKPQPQPQLQSLPQQSQQHHTYPRPSLLVPPPPPLPLQNSPLLPSYVSNSNNALNPLSHAQQDTDSSPPEPFQNKPQYPSEFTEHDFVVEEPSVAVDDEGKSTEIQDIETRSSYVVNLGTSARLRRQRLSVVKTEDVEDVTTGGLRAVGGRRSIGSTGNALQDVATSSNANTTPMGAVGNKRRRLGRMNVRPIVNANTNASNNSANSAPGVESPSKPIMGTAEVKEEPMDFTNYDPQQYHQHANTTVVVNSSTTTTPSTITTATAAATTATTIPSSTGVKSVSPVDLLIAAADTLTNHSGGDDYTSNNVNNTVFNGNISRTDTIFSREDKEKANDMNMNNTTSRAMSTMTMASEETQSRGNGASKESAMEVEEISTKFTSKHHEAYMTDSHLSQMDPFSSLSISTSSAVPASARWNSSTSNEISAFTTTTSGGNLNRHTDNHSNSLKEVLIIEKNKPFLPTQATQNTQEQSLSSNLFQDRRENELIFKSSLTMRTSKKVYLSEDVEIEENARKEEEDISSPAVISSPTSRNLDSVEVEEEKEKEDQNVENDVDDAENLQSTNADNGGNFDGDRNCKGNENGDDDAKSDDDAPVEGKRNEDHDERGTEREMDVDKNGNRDMDEDNDNEQANDNDNEKKRRGENEISGVICKGDDDRREGGESDGNVNDEADQEQQQPQEQIDSSLSPPSSNFSRRNNFSRSNNSNNNNNSSSNLEDTQENSQEYCNNIGTQMNFGSTQMPLLPDRLPLLSSQFIGGSQTDMFQYFTSGNQKDSSSSPDTVNVSILGRTASSTLNQEGTSNRDATPQDELSLNSTQAETAKESKVTDSEKSKSLAFSFSSVDNVTSASQLTRSQFESD